MFDRVKPFKPLTRVAKAPQTLAPDTAPRASSDIPLSTTIRLEFVPELMEAAEKHMDLFNAICNQLDINGSSTLGGTFFLGLSKEGRLFSAKESTYLRVFQGAFIGLLHDFTQACTNLLDRHDVDSATRQQFEQSTIQLLALARQKTAEFTQQ